MNSLFTTELIALATEANVVSTYWRPLPPVSPYTYRLQHVPSITAVSALPVLYCLVYLIFTSRHDTLQRDGLYPPARPSARRNPGPWRDKFTPVKYQSNRLIIR